MKQQTMTDHNSIDFAISAIRQYLADKPEAADTLEGIHQWWIRLHWPGYEESQMVTLTALERLERAGEVEQFNSGGNIVWRRRR